MWRKFYFVEYAIDDDTLYVRLRTSQKGKPLYHLPLGPDIQGSIKKIAEEVLSTEPSVDFITIPPELLHLFDQYKNRMRVTPEYDIYDYIYNAAEIKALEGSRFSKQRNHISRFKKDNPDWEYIDIKDADISEVIDFFKNTYLTQVTDPADSQIEDNERTLELLENISLYGFCGGVLKAGGKIIGFTFGEKLHGILFDQVEKADRNYSGAYQMLFHEFALHEADDSIELINREDDAGDPGLRKAKLAYHPIRMEEKNTVNISK